MKKWGQKLVVILLAASLQMPLTMRSQAHDELTFYTSRWFNSHHTGWDLKWRFSPSFPDGNGNKRDRVKDAFTRWNSLAGNLEFERLPESGEMYVLECSYPQGYNGMFWLDYPDNIVAQTGICNHEDYAPYVEHNFWIIFNSDKTWYELDNTPVPSEWDLESIATHEVGHATGFGAHYDQSHFENGSNTCSVEHPPTMCEYGGYGNAERRSLEDHDWHTFNSAY